MDIGEKEKEFGVIGSASFLMSMIPFFLGGFLALVASVFLLISIYNHSKKIFNDKNIFRKFVIGWVFIMLSIIILCIGLFIGRVFLRSVAMNYNSETFLSNYGGIISVGTIVGSYVLIIVGSYFFRECLAILAKYTNIKCFKILGNIIFWGAIGIPVGGLGLIAMYIGWVILAVAFYFMPPSSQLVKNKNP